MTGTEWHNITAEADARCGVSRADFATLGMDGYMAKLRAQPNYLHTIETLHHLIRRHYLVQAVQQAPGTRSPPPRS